MASVVPKTVHTIDWSVDSPEIGRVCTLLGVKPDAGVVLDFMDMDVAGLFDCDTLTTGQIAEAWVTRKLARVRELNA